MEIVGCHLSNVFSVSISFQASYFWRTYLGNGKWYVSIKGHGNSRNIFTSSLNLKNVEVKNLNIFY